MDVTNIATVNHSALHSPDRAAELRVQDSQVKTVEEETKGEETVPIRSDGPKGVLRLLAAGHFKGVADVRLRINFHEELQLGQQEVVEAATEDVSAFLEVSENLFATVVGSDQLTEEQEDAIRELGDSFISELGDSLEEATNEDIHGLAAGIESSFNSLQKSLLQLSEKAEEAILIDRLITDLTEAFDQLMEGLNTLPRISSLSSRPQNNGAAYDKFLGIYQELLYPSGSSEGAETLDIEA